MESRLAYFKGRDTFIAVHEGCLPAQEEVRVRLKAWLDANVPLNDNGYAATRTLDLPAGVKGTVKCFVCNEF